MKFHTDLLKYIYLLSFSRFWTFCFEWFEFLFLMTWQWKQRISCPDQCFLVNASITLYWTCMLCLDCQHFDLIVWIGSLTNLHMSSSWYLQTIGKELNRSFRQMFMGQECVTSPKERLRGRLKEHAVSKIIRKQEEKNKYYCSFWVDLLWKHHAETCEVVV